MTTKLYKDKDNNIYNFPLDGSQDHFIGDKVAVTTASADSLTKAKMAPQRKAMLDRLPYDAKRAMEYPSVEDQLDAIWKGGATEEKMKIFIQAVKAKYPKPPRA